MRSHHCAAALFCAICFAFWTTRAPAAAAAPAGGIAVLRTASSPTTRVEEKEFYLAAGEKRLAVADAAQLTAGDVTFELLDPAGNKLYSHGGRVFSVGPRVLADLSASGRYRVRIIAEGAVGRWQTSIAPVPPPGFFALQLLGSIGMILVAAGAVFCWRRWSHGSARWLWVGAALWAAGVAMKSAWAIATNRLILQNLENALPRGGYLLLGSLYVGLLTGVFEVGVVALAGLIWRKLSADPARAAGVGVGAGAFEASLLGLGSLAMSAIVLVNGSQAQDGVTGTMSLLLATTPLAWLVAPAERAIVITCHVSARMLALLGVAQRRWLPFWAGFAILTLVDCVAGAAQLSGRLGMFSMWWIELAILPFALISIPLVRLCVRRWPPAPNAPPPQAESPEALAVPSK
jgi:uncharacterized membrane protein YhfC